MEQIVNMSDPKSKNFLLSHMRELDGTWRVELVRHRPRRSDRQNRWYWPCFVASFGDWLRAQGDDYTDQEAHEFLRGKFLRRTVVNNETGEIIGDTVTSTASLTTAEFNEYLDKCAAWLAEFTGAVIPEPNIYHAREEL